MSRPAAINPFAFARLALAVVAVFAFVVTGTPHPGHAAQPTKAQRELQKILSRQRYWKAKLAAEQKQESKLQNTLVTTKGKIEDQREKLSEAKAQSAQQQLQLEQVINQYQNQIQGIRGQLNATRTQYKRVHAQAQVLLTRMHVLEARIGRESGHVRRAIVEMYQLSQVSPLETVLESSSLTQYLTQQQVVDQIGSHDAAILLWAEREHKLVHAAATRYLQKMADLRALQSQERTQLKLVVVETQHENLLLIKAQRLASKQQANIKRTEASIQALARAESSELQSVAGTAQTSAGELRQDQQSAEKVGWIIEQQTGSFPNIGNASGLRWPVIGPITQPFGPTPYPFEPAVTYNGVFYPHFHTGIDIAAPFQSPIHAAAAGKVIFASLFVPGQLHASYGLCVIIMHSDTLSTLYAHLDNTIGLRVHVGQIVSGGQVIGYEGVTGNTTGPHLHFEVRVNNIWVNPLAWLPKEPDYYSQ